MLSPITDAASAILEILKDRNIVLFVLMFAFWMLFYGIFRISTFKLTHLFGDDPASKKLSKIISGTLSAIIVLGSLAIVPPEKIIERAIRIMSVFNTLFIIFLALIIFLVFKFFLFSKEDESIKNLGSFIGALLALYIIGSLTENELLYSLSFMAAFVLLIYAVTKLFSGDDETTYKNFNYDDELSGIRDMDEKKQYKRINEINRSEIKFVKGALALLKDKITEFANDINRELKKLEHMKCKADEIIDKAKDSLSDDLMKSVKSRAESMKREIEDYENILKEDIANRLGVLDRSREKIKFLRRKRKEIFSEFEEKNIPLIRSDGRDIMTLINRAESEISAIDKQIIIITAKIRDSSEELDNLVKRFNKIKKREEKETK